MSSLLWTHEMAVDSAIPWWWKDVFVPVAVAILCSLLTLLCSLWVASRTNWYRRLSRWEPYRNELWRLQITLYGEICQAARKAMGAASDLAWNHRDGDPDNNKPLSQAYSETKSKLDMLGMQAKILLIDPCTANEPGDISVRM